jgi:transcriptional regulator with XRE-family HTH domain
MTIKDYTPNHDSSDTQARKADLIDRHVGKKLREHRRMLEMSQQDVSERLGISYQQIQKYESGANRISAGRLYTLANIMQIPVHKFFEGLPATETLIPRTNGNGNGVQHNGNGYHYEHMGANNPSVIQALEFLIQTIQRAP